MTHPELIQRRRPWLVWAVFGVTAVTTALGYLVPSFADALARDPDFAHGQLWRIITPILVNPAGARQLIVNGVGLLVLGPIAERIYRPARWAALYLTGGLVGEVYSYATHNYGAGSSVAIAGLLGGIAAWLVSGAAEVPLPARVAASFALVGGVALAVLGDNHGTSILAGAALGAGLRWWARRAGTPLPTAPQLRSEMQ